MFLLIKKWKISQNRHLSFRLPASNIPWGPIRIPQMLFFKLLKIFTLYIGVDEYVKQFTNLDTFFSVCIWMLEPSPSQLLFITQCSVINMQKCLSLTYTHNVILCIIVKKRDTTFIFKAQLEWGSYRQESLQLGDYTQFTNWNSSSGSAFNCSGRHFRSRRYRTGGTVTAVHS